MSDVEHRASHVRASQSVRNRGIVKASVTLATFALLSAAAAGAHATVMVEVQIEDMIRDADVIVHGVIERSDVRLSLRAGHSEPQTITRVRVTRWLKGQGGARVVIREIGGEMQGRGLRIDGIPRYAVGEEVVVFLTRLERDVYRTYGMAQGKMLVRRGVPGVPTRVVRDLEGIGFARWENGEMQIDEETKRPVPLALDGLVDLVDQVLALGRAR